MNHETYKKLKEVWNRYRLYAESCIRNGNFPAPFGTTKEERDLKEEVHQQSTKKIKNERLD